MSSLKFDFTFPKVTFLSIIFIFALSEIFTSPTDSKSDSLQLTVQVYKTGFTAYDTVQVYIIINWFHD